MRSPSPAPRRGGGPGLGSARGRARRRGPAGRPRHLPVDRRASAHQCARHVHHPQRLHDAARSARGHGRGGPALRAPRRAGGGHRRPPGHPDRRGMGARHVAAARPPSPTPPPPAWPAATPTCTSASRTSTGSPRTKSIIPRHSRNVYDAALRGVGVRVIEVTTPAELEAALGPRTALIYILAGPEADESALPTKLVASIAQPRGVPVLVDAAAEILTVPNVHLQNGATLVGYSGGKCLRGPQAAGPAAGAQGPGQGGLGPQRAPSRLRARLQGRQGRGDRDADGGRDVDEARPRGGVGAWTSWLDPWASASPPSPASPPQWSSRRGCPTACRPCASSGTARSSAWPATRWRATLFEGTRGSASSPPATTRIPPSPASA